MPTSTNTCNYCIHCEYRNKKYHCLSGGDDYEVERTDPACEDFILSALPALHDKNRATPRAMGMQWTPTPTPDSFSTHPRDITKTTKGENL